MSTYEKEKLRLRYVNGRPANCGGCIVLCKGCIRIKSNKYYPDITSNTCRHCADNSKELTLYCWYLNIYVKMYDKPICKESNILKHVIKEI